MKRIELTDAELDYCNAEGISATDFANRKASPKLKGRKSKRRHDDDDDEIAPSIRDLINTHKDSPDSLKRLRAMFLLWVREAEKHMHTK